MATQPYGSWPSPISLSSLTAGSAGLARSAGLAAAGGLFWTQLHPGEDGRVALYRSGEAGGPATEVAPGRSVRNAINEYGGGAFTAALVDDQEVVVYSSWPTGELRVAVSGEDRLLAPGGGLRYGSLSIDEASGEVLAVREDHRGDGLPMNTVVALGLHRDNADGGRILASGADFYARPTASADGRLAWVQWDFPNMPWDATTLMVAPRDDLAEAVVVATGASVVYPAWAADGSLIYLSDESGYWNFRRWDGGTSRALHAHPWDFCTAMWTPDVQPYSLIDATHIGCSWLVDGLAHLGVLDCATGQLRALDSPAVEARVHGGHAVTVALLGYADRPRQMVALNWADGQVRALADSDTPSSPDLAGCISVGQPIAFDGDFGLVHAWYYPPTNSRCQAPDGELPPLQVWSHGGPTGFASPAFDLRTQFWTSRGIGIVDVNYSGSTGFGRDYRNRLKGLWGVADVADCAQAAQALVAQGLADPNRLSIRGGSAGGFTTLAALTFTDVFSAGISLYGVGDLPGLATDTHKFESRYLDGLIAPYPEGRQVYLDRSPRYHLDGLSCPMLILQGADDLVVPPDQAYAMADAVAAKGLPVRLIVFEGEGHGFRKAESLQQTEAAALQFLGEVHGFTPAA